MQRQTYCSGGGRGASVAGRTIPCRPVSCRVGARGSLLHSMVPSLASSQKWGPLERAHYRHPLLSWAQQTTRRNPERLLPSWARLRLTRVAVSPAVYSVLSTVYSEQAHASRRELSRPSEILILNSQVKGEAQDPAIRMPRGWTGSLGLN